jgi:hypothetical protein
MPNHVTTRCLVSGPDDAVNKFRKRAYRIEDSETVFDFNAFVPMPAIIKNTKSGSVAEEGAALLCIVRDRAPPFAMCEATDELFELVYGYAPETEGGAA